MFKLRKLEDRIVLDGAGALDALGEAYAHEVHDSVMHDYAQNSQDIHDGDYGFDGQEPLYAVDGTDFTDDGGVHVLVISSDINDADDLETAAKDGVIVVRYDASGTTTEDLSGLISDALDGREADTMAFATHNAALDSLESDADQQAFWQAVGAMIAEGGRIDLLACNAVEDAAGEAFVAKIEELSGTDVAASADPTGNGAYGGNWVLESDGVDIQSTYFDADRLENFDGVMQNTRPVIQNNNPLNISAETFGVIDQNLLLVTDPDSADWAGALRYTLSTTPNDGTLFFDANGSGTVDGNETILQAGHKFTQAQIYTDRLTYLHNGARDTVETFQFSVTDSAGESTGYETFTINVTQNVNPVIVANNGMTVVENSFGVINGSDLTVEDGDNTTGSLTYTLKAPLPQHGTLWFDDNLNGEIDGNEVALDSSQNNTFTQDQLNENKLTYRHNGLYQGPILDSFNFTVKDDNTAGNANGVFRITIEGYNDAPAEVEIGEITVKHEAVNITSAHLNFTDADNSPYYLTYTLDTISKYGDLYLLDRGADGILNTDDDTISYLDEGDTFTQTDVNFGRLHFDRSTPKGYEDVADIFTFTVSDPDGTLATNDDDGTNTFTFNITVKDLNENPYIFINDALEVNEDGTGVITSDFLTARDYDKNDGPENLTYRITELGEHIDDDGVIDIQFEGSLVLYTDTNTKAWSLTKNESDLSTFTFTQDDIDKGYLKYEYDSEIDDYDRVQFKFKVYDDGDVDGGINAYGESLALGSEEMTFAINVTDKNDAPELQTNEVLTVVEDNEDDAQDAVITKSYLNFNDIDASSSKELIYTLAVVPDEGTLYIDSGDEPNGIMDVGEELAAGNTFTQEDIDSGRLRYNFGGNEPLNDDPNDPDYYFTFTVNDEGTSDDSEVKYAVNKEPIADDPNLFKFNIEVTGVNDKPVLKEGSLVTAVVDKPADDFPKFFEFIDDPATLQIDDKDTSTEDLKYVLTENVNDGILFIDKNGDGEQGGREEILTTGESFTQTDVDDGLLMLNYGPGGKPDVTEKITFKFEVYDGTDMGDEDYEFTIRVIGTNSLPVYTPPGDVIVVEENSIKLNGTVLTVSDAETVVLDLEYTIKELPQYGVLLFGDDEATSAELEIGDTFTHEDVLSNRFRYLSTSQIGSDGVETPDQFKFELRDGKNETTANGIETFEIKIEGQLSVPVVGEITKLTLTEDTSETITTGHLRSYDPDYAEGSVGYSNITYEIDSYDSPAEYHNNFLFIDEDKDGALDGNEIKIEKGASFTQENIDAGKLCYYNDSEPSSSTDTFTESFSFIIKDDEDSRGYGVFYIDVSPNANDVPKPAVGTSLSLNTVLEGNSVYLKKDDIEFTDGDFEIDSDNDKYLEYVLTGGLDHGKLVSGDGDSLKEYENGYRFNISDFNSIVYYQHDGSEETKDSFTIVVYDTYNGDQSLPTTISINIEGVNDKPELVRHGLNVNEGDPDVIITSAASDSEDEDVDEDVNLFVYDPDSGDSLLVYTITDITNLEGTLYLDGVEINLVNGPNSFTQQDIIEEKLTYSNNPDSEVLQEKFTFDVTDSHADSPEVIKDQVFTINVTPENDAPTVGGKLEKTIEENDTDRDEVLLNKTYLFAEDPDDLTGENTSELIYEIKEGPLHGRLELDDGTVLAENGQVYENCTFTQEQVDSNIIYYKHNGDEPDPDVDVDDYFKFTLKDSGTGNQGGEDFLYAADNGDHKNGTVYTFEIRVTPVNDKPVLVNNSITIIEDSATHISENELMATDDDDVSANLVFTLDTTPKYGYLFFDDGDGVWNDEEKLVAGKTFTQSDITNGKLTFQHVNEGNDVYEDSFKFQVADDDDGIATDQIFTINVTNVDDKPEITSKGLTVWEGEGIGLNSRSGVIDGNKLYAFDGDDAPENLTYTVTSIGEADNSFSGILFFDNNGNREYDASHDTAVGVGSQFTQADINKGALTFQHNGDDQFKETFGFTVSDDGLDIDGETTIPVNTAEGTFEINVFGVNDNPELIGPFSSAEVVNATGGETLNFNGVSAEMISIDDPDAGFGKMTVLIDLKPGANDESVGRISADMNIDGAYVEKTSSFIAIEGDRDAVNKVLATLTFTPDSDYTGKAYIAFEVLDNGNIGQGGEGHDSGTLTIDVAEGEPAVPTAANSVAYAAEDMIYTFQSSDFNFNESVEGIFVIPVSANGELQLFTDDEWVAITDPTQDPITVADINGGKLRFKPDGNENDSGYSKFQFRVYNDLSDGTRVFADSANTMTINVMPINDAPENNVPGPQLVKVSTSDDVNFLEFNGNNMIQISDVDSDNTITQGLDYETEISVQLQVGNGILSGLDSSDATVDGNGTSFVTVTGTLSEVNDELSDLKYSSETLGADTLTITTDDGGNYGGVALQDVDIVLIKITESDVTGGGTLPEEALRMNSSSPFTYQFDEFAANFPADCYEIIGKPDWLVFKEESRTFYYVKGITGTAVSGTYEIEVIANYDQSGTAITDTLTIEVAGMDRGVFNALQLLDDTQEYIIPADSETIEVQEVMMASAVMADNAANTEMIEALKLIESGMMA
ncbi:MAG: DUF4347 domain-containing protein [Desulfobacteraceae bacterium]|nr:DUF4347 domain-containing protein [Desulfobacteraceae bacterium]